LALHGERWGGGGAFASPRFRRFHDEVMAALFADNNLELMWITVRGEPFASAYHILWGGRVHYYQCGPRLDLPHNLRPGIALVAYALRRAIEAGRREYDFFSGDYRYKRELATGTRAVVRLRAVRSPRGVRERARVLVEKGRSARRALRRRPPSVSPGERGPTA